MEGKSAMQFFGCTGSLRGGALGRRMTLLLVVAFLGLFFPGQEEMAHALQVHPEPEGLYSHQIAHLFFVLSMAILVFWLRKRGLVAEPGWRLIQWGCIMFVVWNVGAFVGHVVEARMVEEAFVGERWSRALVVQDVTYPGIYLFLKMDHLTCFPAILLLYLGLRKIQRQAGTR
mgnify:CR=1 FL=1